MEEADQDDGHVVAPEPAHGAVRRQAAGHQLLANCVGFQSAGYPPYNKIGHFLKIKT